MCPCTCGSRHESVTVGIQGGQADADTQRYGSIRFLKAETLLDDAFNVLLAADVADWAGCCRW